MAGEERSIAPPDIETIRRKVEKGEFAKVLTMPTCHVCRKELKEGFTSLEFQEDGFTIRVAHIPALVCECGEARIKASVAEYVSDLADQIASFERQRSREEQTERLHVREAALAWAA